MNQIEKCWNEIVVLKTGKANWKWSNQTRNGTQRVVISKSIAIGGIFVRRQEAHVAVGRL